MLMAALMLLINFRVASATCAMPAPAQSATPSRAASATHYHQQPSEADMADDSDAPSDAPSDVPVRGACCQAMASCGTSLIQSQSSTAMVERLAPALAVAAQGKIPVGRIAAPEPPPPKA